MRYNTYVVTTGLVSDDDGIAGTIGSVREEVMIVLGCNVSALKEFYILCFFPLRGGR